MDRTKDTMERHPDEVEDRKRTKKIWTYAASAIVDVLEVGLEIVMGGI